MKQPETWVVILYHEGHGDSGSSGTVCPWQCLRFFYEFWWMINKTVFQLAVCVFFFCLAGWNGEKFAGVQIKPVLAFLWKLEPSPFLLEPLRLYLIREYLKHWKTMQKPMCFNSYQQIYQNQYCLISLICFFQVVHRTSTLKVWLDIATLKVLNTDQYSSSLDTFSLFSSSRGEWSDFILTVISSNKATVI